MSARDALKNTVFRVVDVETTGLDPLCSSVCEIAWQDVGFDGKVVSEAGQDTLIDPGEHIPPEASAVHHIVDADVVNAPGLSDVVPSLLSPPDDRQMVFVAHNSGFEQGFLPDAGPWLCTHRLALHLLPHLKSHGLQYLRYALGLDVDLPRGSMPHRAGADVAVTCSLLGFLLLTGRGLSVLPCSIDDLIEWVNQPAELKHLPFSSSGYALFSEVDDGYLEWIIAKSAGGSDCVYSAQRELERRQS